MGMEELRWTEQRKSQNSNDCTEIEFDEMETHKRKKRAIAAEEKKLDKNMNMANKTFGCWYRVGDAFKRFGVLNFFVWVAVMHNKKPANWMRTIGSGAFFVRSFISIFSNHLVGNSLQVPKIKMRFLFYKNVSFCVFFAVSLFFLNFFFSFFRMSFVPSTAWFVAEK